MALGRDHETWTCRTVMAEGSDEVHLTISAGAGGPLPDVTLCEQPVAPAPPTRRFQERGCRRCAEASLEQGVLGARDRGATINLQRFYARTGSGGRNTRGGASRPGTTTTGGVVPFQLPPSA
jgi:hypothetical protein